MFYVMSYKAPLYLIAVRTKAKYTRYTAQNYTTTREQRKKILYNQQQTETGIFRFTWTLLKICYKSKAKRAHTHTNRTTSALYSKLGVLRYKLNVELDDFLFLRTFVGVKGKTAV